MAKAFMAYPELRSPFEAKEIHPEGSATVLYQGKTVTLTETGDGDGDGDGLLINPKDLGQINGFEIKPEGACFKDLCIPLNDQLLVEQDGKQWFNLTAFADLLDQPYVADHADIELTDRKGQVVRLADLKGKKALIVTWSSW